MADLTTWLPIAAGAAMTLVGGGFALGAKAQPPQLPPHAPPSDVERRLEAAEARIRELESRERDDTAWRTTVEVSLATILEKLRGKRESHGTQ